MTRGDQRERAREKTLKKQSKMKKGTELNGVTLQKKKETDAEIMRLKQKKALEKQEAGSSSKK